jgi:hypothetical protein
LDLGTGVGVGAGAGAFFGNCPGGTDFVSVVISSELVLVLVWLVDSWAVDPVEFDFVPVCP